MDRSRFGGVNNAPPEHPNSPDILAQTSRFDGSRERARDADVHFSAGLLLIAGAAARQRATDGATAAFSGQLPARLEMPSAGRCDGPCVDGVVEGLAGTIRRRYLDLGGTALTRATPDTGGAWYRISSRG
jgi:hypothetical protein